MTSLAPPFAETLIRSSLTGSTKKLSILLVEDSDVDAFLFKSCFDRSELAGSTLRVTRTLSEAVDVLGQSQKIDALFLDLNLPDSEGIDTLKQLLPHTGSRPVIIISAEGDQTVVRNALRSGAQDYLVKGNYDPLRIEHAIIYSIERQRVTTVLQRTQENYERLFQNNPLPAWLFCPSSLRILMVNDAAIRHYGYSSEEFANMTIRDLRPAQEVSRFDEFVKSAPSLEHRSEGENWKHRKKDGTTIDVELSTRAVSINGETLAYAVIHDVTERNRIMHLLKENSRRLDLAVSAGRMMVLDVDYVKNEMHIASSGEGIPGFPTDFFSDLETGMGFIHIEDRLKIRTALEIGRSGVRDDIQFRIIHPVNNSIIWVERRSYLVYDDNGKPIGSRGVVVDITALKQYEEEVLASYRSLESAAERQSAILDSLPAHIALLDKEGGIVAVNDAWKSYWDRNGKGSFGEWIGRSYFDTHEHEAGIESIHAGIREVLGGRRKKFEVEYPWNSPTDRRWFRVSACTINTAGRGGAVIMHVDITERKKVENELLQSRANLLSIFESTEDSYVLIDPQHRILASNNRAREDFPYLNASDVIGKEVFSSLPMDRKKPFQTALDVVRKEKRATQYEAVYDLYNDSTKRYFQIRVTPVLSDGIFLGYTVCGHDITPHKRIEQALADREQRFRALIENSGDMFTITDDDNRIVYGSPNIENILGYPVEQIVGKTFSSLLHPDDRPYYYFVIEQTSREKGKLIQKSSRMFTRTGEELWTEGTIIDLSDIPAVGGTVTNFRDITEKINTQRELDHNRYILDKANEVTKIGYWVLDLKSAHRPLSWSPQLFNIFGVQESGFTGNPEFFGSLIHKDDNAIRRAALESALNGNREYSIDYRINRPDAQLMWVHEQAEVFFDGEKPAFVVGVVQDITERKVNEQTIRESKHNLDALINNTSDFLWSCDKDLRLISGNSAFYKQVRAQYQVALNEGDRVIVLGDNNPRMVPWMLAYQAALSGKQMAFETVSGTEEVRTYFQNTLNPIWDNGEVVGVAGFSRNITERKEFENRITAVNERFEILSKATNDAVWDWDMVADRITWNHGLTSIYGHDPSNRETDFQWWCELVHPDDLAFVQGTLNDAFETNHQLWSCSYRFRSADSSYRYALDRGFIIYDGGKPVRMIGAQQDVHELTQYRMSLEQKVAERTIELQEALEKEKHLSEMKSRFVSIASHEFRTPLSTIQFATDFVMRYKHKLEPADIDRKLSSISLQVKHMMVLLDDVLTVSKGDSGKIQVHLSEVNIREFVLELTGNMKESAATHEIDVQFDLQRDLIISDEKLLMNVLSNLLSNAIKFSSGESRISVYCAHFAGSLIFEVSDNGIGINDHEKESIYEPFSRGADVGAISGTGLGLSIVRTAVKLLHGTIELSRNETFKTVFRVEIPV